MTANPRQKDANQNYTHMKKTDCFLQFHSNGDDSKGFAPLKHQHKARLSVPGKQL
jgi:hypothetical protein